MAQILKDFVCLQGDREHGSAVEPEEASTDDEVQALPPLDLTSERAAVSTAYASDSTFNAAQDVSNVPSSLPQISPRCAVGSVCPDRLSS